MRIISNSLIISMALVKLYFQGDYQIPCFPKIRLGLNTLRFAPKETLGLMFRGYDPEKSCQGFKYRDYREIAM